MGELEALEKARNGVAPFKSQAAIDEAMRFLIAEAPSDMLADILQLDATLRLSRERDIEGERWRPIETAPVPKCGETW